MHRIALPLGLVLAALAAQDPAPPPPPPGAPSPGPGDSERAPVTLRRLHVLLLRAERNLFLHGLSLHEKHLARAVADYREALACMPPVASDGDRFTAAFGLLFSMSRMEPPAAGPARTAMDREWRATMALAEGMRPEFAGLAVVAGTMASAVGDAPRAVELLDDGLTKLAALDYLFPWQTDQLRFFGLLGRGAALMDARMGREDLALADFEAAEVLARRFVSDPAAPRGSRSLVLALSHKAAAEQKIAYYARAEATLDSLLLMDPGVALHAYNRGLVAAWQQKFDEALRWYRAAVRLDPRDHRPRLKIAYLLLKYPPGGGAPRIQEARPEGEAYLSLAGAETGEYCAFQGEVARLEGRLAAAEEWFRKALKHDPDCRHALYCLVQILGQEGSRSASREADLEALKVRLAEQSGRRFSRDGMEGPRLEVTFC